MPAVQAPLSLCMLAYAHDAVRTKISGTNELVTHHYLLIISRMVGRVNPSATLFLKSVIRGSFFCFNTSLAQSVSSYKYIIINTLNFACWGIFYAFLLTADILFSKSTV